MDIRPIKTDDDLTQALGRISTLWNAPDDTPEGDELDILVTLVHAFEAKAYPLERSTPLEMLRFDMEQNDRTQSDLAAVLGSRSRASEILAGKKTLTLDQIRKVHKAWRIPVSCLVGELEDA